MDTVKRNDIITIYIAVVVTVTLMLIFWEVR